CHDAPFVRWLRRQRTAGRRCRALDPGATTGTRACRGERASATLTHTIQIGHSICVSRSVIEEFVRRDEAPPAALPAVLGELTPREHEVLDLLAAGLSNPEICSRLVISEATAKTHVARILQGLRDRVQVVIYAYEVGLVRPGAGPRP
ncbi:MAG: response regulator transcription factor, partial [Actinobacteria bacterium]